MSKFSKIKNFIYPSCEEGSSFFFSLIFKAILIIGVLTGWSGKEEILTIALADIIMLFQIRYNLEEN